MKNDDDGETSQVNKIKITLSKYCYISPNV